MERRSERVSHCINLCRLYRTSYSILLSFILAGYLAIFKSKPPRFPIDKDADVIDCLNIDAIKLYNENSRIKVELSVGKFLEFPSGIAPELIRIRVNGSSGSGEYSRGDFWDFQNHQGHITFCVLQQIGGTLTADLVCQRDILKSITFQLPTVDIIPVPMTKELNSYDSVANIHNGCFHSGIFKYFIKPEYSIHPLVTGYNHTIPVIVHKQSNAHSYSMEHSINYLTNPVLIIGSKSTSPSRILLDIVLPVWASMQTKYHGRLVDFLVLDNSRIDPVLHSLSPNSSIYRGSQCFKESWIVRTYGSASHDSNMVVSMEQEHLRWILSYNRNVIKSLKGVFHQDDSTDTIVFEYGVPEDVINCLSAKYPTYTHCILSPNDDLLSIISAVGESKVFVAHSLDFIPFSIFLNEGNPCIGIGDSSIGDYVNKFSSLSSTKGVFIPWKPECSCGSVECCLKEILNREL